MVMHSMVMTIATSGIVLTRICYNPWPRKDVLFILVVFYFHYENELVYFQRWKCHLILVDQRSVPRIKAGGYYTKIGA